MKAPLRRDATGIVGYMHVDELTCHLDRLEALVRSELEPLAASLNDASRAFDAAPPVTRCSCDRLLERLSVLACRVGLAEVVLTQRSAELMDATGSARARKLIAGRFRSLGAELNEQAEAIAILRERIRSRRGTLLR